MYTLKQLKCDLGRDIDAYLGFAAEYNRGAHGWRSRASALFMPSVMACLLYRISHWLHSHRLRRLALSIAWINLQLTKVSINPASQIGGGLYIPHPATGIVFQGIAGRDLKLMAGSGATAGPFSPLHSYESSEMPHLGDNVSLGSKAFVIGPVSIGSGVKIGFNSCITQDVASGAIVVAPHVRNRVIARKKEGDTCLR